nr:MazG nucleotide pyrophosphohydrolase domain-containing protein [Roseibium sp. CAU 1639]
MSEIEAGVATVSDIYAARFDIERDSTWYLAKLTEELGELTAADLKCNGKARTNGETAAKRKQALVEETADLFAHLLLFCRDREIDLEEAVRGKWLKYLAAERTGT